MKLRTILATAAIAMTAVATVATRAEARDLTIVSWGGAYQDAQREVYFRPFTKATGIPIKEDSWDGGIGILRSKIESGSNTWDLVQVESEELLIGCEEGLFEKINWDLIGGKDHYIPQSVSECGVGAILYNIVLAWDKDKFQGTPTWADFWDVAKYPGKRGLRRGVKMNLEIALMADGVAPGDVYKTLSTPEGVDRAFRKLDQLKPYIVWWQAGAQAPQILGSGDVLMTSAYNGRIAAANDSEHRHFGIQWNGSLNTVDSWIIMKGSPNAKQAYEFLKFVSDSKRQGQLTQKIPYGGIAKGANDGLPAELVKNSPSNPENLKVSLTIDENFWRDNLDKLSQRFNAWLAR